LYISYAEADRKPTPHTYYNLATEYFNRGDYDNAKYYMLITANYNEIHDTNIKPESTMGIVIRKAMYKYKIVNQRMKILNFHKELKENG
jgi:hypothetical protein